MDEHIEEYQPKDHSDLNFVYDEDIGFDTEGNTETETITDSEPEAHFSKRQVGMVIAVLVCLILTVIIYFANREIHLHDATKRVESIVSTEIMEESIYENTTQSDESAWKKMENYLRVKYKAEDVWQAEENGRYEVNRYLVLDLDDNTSTPEGMALLWSEEEACYQLLVCSFQNTSGAEEEKTSISSSLMNLEDTQNRFGSVDAMIVNHSETSRGADLIIEMRQADSSVSSILLHYENQCWNELGVVDGTAELFTEEDGAYRYDLDGLYRFAQPYAFFDGIKAIQYWQINGGELYSDYQVDYNAMYWKLENAPQWYMKRPVVAYAGIDFVPWSQTLQILEGNSLRIIGVYEKDGNSFYKVETDTGEQGFILMNGLEKGTKAQVQLQSLPFEEVFSESALSEEELTEDAYEPVLPVISAPFDMELQPGETYTAWIDLNGDGLYEKLSASSQWNPNKEGVFYKVSVDDIQLLYNTYNESGLRLFVMDMDKNDQWLELGYYLSYNNKAVTEMYRYDGWTVRSLGLADGLCFDGIPELDQMLTDGASTLLVKGSWTGYDFWYSISFDPRTGTADQAAGAFLTFDELVPCRPLENTVLYTEKDGTEEIEVREDENLRLLGMEAVLASDGEWSYYGYLELEDGTYAYTKALEDYYSIIVYLDLSTTFGLPLAG